MTGFGVQTKNINELIAKIEKEINFITANFDKNVTVLNNKLSICSSELQALKNDFKTLKDYTQAEYEYVENKIAEFETKIDYIKSNLNKINYGNLSGGKCASGIAPLAEYEQTGETYPIYAKFAERDRKGNIIDETYITSADFGDVISAINARINENSANISAMSSTISNINNRLNNVENTIAAATTSYTIEPYYVITAIEQQNGKIINVGTADNAATTAQVNDFIQW